MGVSVMIINRFWAMPDRWTFRIKPIAELLSRYVGDGKGWIDPFAGKSELAEYRNDLSVSGIDSYDWVNSLNHTFNGCLFDPPYSPRQVSECYKSVGLKASQLDTSSNFLSKMKDIIHPKIINNGLAISFGWNSNGFGKSRGFELIEILMVSHGGWHNDTIVTVERKIQDSML